MAPSTRSNGLVRNVQDSTSVGSIITLTLSVTPIGLSARAAGYLLLYLRLTREQLDAKFALEQQRVKADLAAVEARTVCQNKESYTRSVTIQSEAVIALLLETKWMRRNP